MSAPATTPAAPEAPASPPPAAPPGGDFTPPTTPAPESPAAPVTKPVAGQWDALPVEIRGAPGITKYNSVEELARAKLEVDKLVGAKGIIPPGKDATPEQITAFHEALGTPKDPTGYAVAKDFKPPEGLPWNPELLPGILPIFKKAGVSDAAATEIVNAYAQAQGSAYQKALVEMAQGREAGVVELHREWGNAYDAKMNLAQRAFKAAAGNRADRIGAMTLADGTPLAEHPDIQWMFANVGKGQGEHALLGDASRRLTQTPEEASRELLKLETDEATRKIILDRMHPEHDALMARRSALHAAKVAK